MYISVLKGNEINSKMNTVERHQIILDKIKQEGQLNVVNLRQELNVSSVTIRKDLKFLEDKGLLFRIHGGATMHNPYTSDLHVQEKEKLHYQEKMKIGKAGAKLIQPDDSILIASGTTVLALAKNIMPQGHLTVITSALNVALQLTHHNEIDVIQLGGLLRKNSTSVTGPYAQAILKDFSCSKLYMGVDGIDVGFGISTANIMEAHLNKEMMQVSQKVIVLTDSSKFGKRAVGKICELEDVDEIITDKGISAYSHKALEEAGIQVRVV